MERYPDSMQAQAANQQMYGNVTQTTPDGVQVMNSIERRLEEMGGLLSNLSAATDRLVGVKPKAVPSTPKEPGIADSSASALARLHAIDTTLMRLVNNLEYARSNLSSFV